MMKLLLSCLFLGSIAFGAPNLPFAFEENQGQAASGAFLARGKGYRIALASDSAEMSFGVSPLTMRLMNANRRSKGEGNAKLPGFVNYIRGTDPDKWKHDIATYQKVRFRNVYPGIDVVYYGNQGQLEFDFIVAPGSDPGAILLDFDGAGKLKIDAGGNLAATVEGSELRIRTPVIYQEVAGVRKPVVGRFHLEGNHRASFQLASYDKLQALIIDPTIVYSTVVGGSGVDYGASVAVDSTGNIYMTGTTSSNDFPLHGAVQTTNGGSNIFITKLNPTATSVLYSTYLGGNGADVPSGIAVDSSGDIFVAGYTNSSNFPQSNALSYTVSAGLRGFVVKMNASGSALTYSTYLGGSGTGSDRVLGLALDATGIAYVTGSTTSTTFPTTTGAYSGTLPGSSAGVFSSSALFLTKFNASGSLLTYSSLIGAGEGDSVAIDSVGAAYVTGFITSLPSQTALVFKMNPAGTAQVYSTSLGSTSFEDGRNEHGRSIAVDSTGLAYIAGDTNSAVFPVTSNAAQNVLGGGHDGFFVKVNAAGSSLYSTYLGGRNDDFPKGVALDNSGNIVIAGVTSSPNFPVSLALQNAMGGNVISLLSYNSSTQTWQASDSGFLGVAQAVSSNPSTGSIVVGTDSGTYRSLDNGATWSRTSAFSLSHIARAPSLPATLFGLSLTDVYRSTDDGVTWVDQMSVASLPPLGLAIDPTNPAIVSIYGYNALLRSTDSFQTFTSSPIPYPIFAIAAAPGSPSVILSIQNSSIQNNFLSRSVDSGTTWTASSIAGSGLSQDPNALGTVYVFGSGAFLSKSTDSGVTWTQIPTPSVVTKLAIAQGNSAKLYAVTAGGVIISSDSGSHWSTPAQGLGSAPVVAITASASTAFALEPLSSTGFITKLNPAGTAFVYSTFLGGTASDYLTSVATAGSDAVVTGYTSSVNFPITAGTVGLAVNAIDALVTRISDATATCTYSVNPTLLSYPLAGGINSVSVVSPAACAWNASSASSWISISSNNSSGSGTLSITVAANTGIARTGTVTIGSLPISIQQASAGSTPTTVSLSPSSASGNTQVFTAVYSDPLGATVLNRRLFLINSVLSAASACFVQVDPTGTYLVNDTDSALLGPLTGTGTLSNSQCTLNGTGTSAVNSGITSTVTASLTFKAAFAGAKSIFMYTDDSAGNNSNWQLLGSYTAIAVSSVPATVSVTPASASGTSQVFTATYSDPAGATVLNRRLFLINSALSATGACFVQVDPSGTYLVNDADSALLGPLSSSGSFSNSQCTLNGAGTSVVNSGVTSTIAISLTFSSGFTGAKNIYMYTEDTVGNNSNWQLRGSFTSVIVSSVPATVSVTPSAGSGSNQVFTATYSDPAGASALNRRLFLINSALSATGACFIQNDPTGTYLVNDADSALLGPLTSNGILSNSQCSLNGIGTSVLNSGTSSTVTASVTFKSGFTGAKNIYMYTDDAAGNNSNWQLRGSFSVLFIPSVPSAVSVSPTSGSGASQLFTAVYSDPAGASALNRRLFIINSALNGSGACFVQVDPSGTYLVNDADSSLLGPLVGNATLSNSQCILNGSGTSVVSSGTTSTLTASVVFKSAFAGLKNIYMYTDDSSGNNSNWQLLGSFSVLSVASVPATVAVTPSSGTGNSQVFTATYSDPAGAIVLNRRLFLVNSALSALGACFVQVDPTGTYLVNDADSALLGPLTGSGTLANTQCTLNGTGTSMVNSGTTSTLTLSLTFKSPFAGAKSIYMYTDDPAGNNSNWQLRGTFTTQ